MSKAVGDLPVDQDDVDWNQVDAEIGGAGKSALLMWVGEYHYPWPHDFSDEVKSVGLSKRVAESAIPLIVPGRSRLALIHPRAIVQLRVGMVEELCRSLGFTLPDLGDDTITADQVGRALAALEKTDPKGYDALVEKMGISYHAGIFGYVWLTGLQYVCRPDEEEAPEELKALGVEAVRMDYE